MGQVKPFEIWCDVSIKTSLNSGPQLYRLGRSQDPVPRKTVLCSSPISTCRPEESNLTGGATIPRKAARADDLESVDARPHNHASCSRYSRFRENACPSGPPCGSSEILRETRPLVSEMPFLPMDKTGTMDACRRGWGKSGALSFSTPQIRILVSNRVPPGITSNSSNQGFPMGSDSIDSKRVGTSWKIRTSSADDRLIVPRNSRSPLRTHVESSPDERDARGDGGTQDLGLGCSAGGAIDTGASNPD